MRKKRYLFLAVLGVAIFFGSFFTPVKSDSCHSSSDSCPEEIENILTSVKKKPLLLAKSALDYQLAREVSLSSHKINTSLLGDVDIYVTEKIPGVGFQLMNSEDILLYTNNGEFCGTTRNSTVPIVHILTQFPLDETQFISMLGSEVSNLLVIKQMSVQNETFNVITNDGIKVIFPISGDIDTLLGKLIVSFSQLNGASEKIMIEGADGNKVKPNVIDLRFKDPILRVDK